MALVVPFHVGVLYFLQGVTFSILGQTFEDFGEYASVAVEGSASASTLRVLQNYLRSIEYESFLELISEFQDLVDEDGFYVVA